MARDIFFISRNMDKSTAQIKTKLQLEPLVCVYSTKEKKGQLKLFFPPRSGSESSESSQESSFSLVFLFMFDSVCWTISRSSGAVDKNNLSPHTFCDVVKIRKEWEREIGDIENLRMIKTTWSTMGNCHVTMLWPGSRFRYPSDRRNELYLNSLSSCHTAPFSLFFKRTDQALILYFRNFSSSLDKFWLRYNFDYYHWCHLLLLSC